MVSIKSPYGALPPSPIKSSSKSVKKWPHPAIVLLCVVAFYIEFVAGPAKAAVPAWQQEEDNYPRRRMTVETSTIPKKASSTPEPAQRQCAKHKGLIVSSMLGRTANNLFELAAANRLSQELCWPIVFRQGWTGVFPHNERARQCFPYAMPAFQRDDPVTDWEKEWFDYMNISEATQQKWLTPEQFFKEVPLAEHRDKYGQWQDQSKANGTAINLGARYHYDYKKGWDNDLIEKLRNPDNQYYTIKRDSTKRQYPYDAVRTLHLDNFFIQYDWMDPWMDSVREWLAMDTKECCRNTPPEDAVVIHVRNFEGEGSRGASQLDPKFHQNAYFQVLDRYYQGKPVWIVCQPQDMKSELVQQLVQRYNGIVQPGADPYDALCILTSAKHLLLSTHSTFSQMPALLGNVQDVHYLLPSLKKPLVTLAVPHWNYHLVDLETKDTIQKWNVNWTEIDTIMC